MCAALHIRLGGGSQRGKCTQRLALLFFGQVGARKNAEQTPIIQDLFLYQSQNNILPYHNNFPYAHGIAGNVSLTE